MPQFSSPYRRVAPLSKRSAPIPIDLHLILPTGYSEILNNAIKGKIPTVGRPTRNLNSHVIRHDHLNEPLQGIGLRAYIMASMEALGQRQMQTYSTREHMVWAAASKFPRVQVSRNAESAACRIYS